MKQSFVIYGRLPSLNEYINMERSNRYGANGIKQEYQHIIRMAIKLHNLQPQNEPVFINYKWYEANMKRDADNVVFAQKFVQDALVQEGILENDGRKNVVGFTHKVLLDRKNPRIEIEVVGANIKYECDTKLQIPEA